MKQKSIYAALLSFSLMLGLVGTASAEERGSQDDQARIVGSTLEIHIQDRGNVLVRGAKVTAVSGNTITAATTWGSSTVVWNINTSAKTEFLRRFGGNSSIAEISVGDFLSFKGMLDMSVVSPLTVNAQIVKNWSVQKKHATFYGTVQSVDASTMTFMLTTEESGTISVTVSSSTKIMKGDNAGTWSDIAVGSKITAQGLYDTVNKKLLADKVKIHLPGVVRTTLEGTVKTAPASSTLPTSFVVTAKGYDYTVNLLSDTSLLNVLWLRLPLTSIKVGDSVRVYGAVNTNYTVDATVIRDTSVRL